MAGDVAQEAGRARHILVPNGNSANIGRPSSTASYMAKASPRGAPTTEMPPLRHHYRPSKRLHREANLQSEEILPPAPPSRRYSSEEKAQREHVHNTRFQRQDNQSAEVVPKHGRKHRLPEIITLHDDRFCGRPGHLHSHFSDSSPEASGAEDEDDNNDDVDAMLASAAITGILLLRAASKPKLVHEVVVVSSPTSPTEEGEIFELEL
ncbi:hypothetical protein BDY17DRAFT_36256 [Neohortaea acidophila]|uniref:Uncharacterized protein n=1 Tax=Neohortaea acidophila TaxID=245834 RepID=A0A6A6PK75_9PEZI|nr:uncharacterized protein BDY17DRAFT_36256 [Neohortaea acidophila]KAF2480335.1 hypothetical protein BDY17DRAFT_36256 [Neohortaea acidophila]